MSNAALCLSRAALYERLADEAGSPNAGSAFRAVAARWRQIATLAEDFDRRSDPMAKERIYALVEEVAEEQRKVA